jgi:hypothetical protein
MFAMLGSFPNLTSWNPHRCVHNCAIPAHVTKRLTKFDTCMYYGHAQLPTNAIPIASLPTSLRSLQISGNPVSCASVI